MASAIVDPRAIPRRDELLTAARQHQRLIALLGRRTEGVAPDSALDSEIARNRTRDRIRLVHNVIARRQQRRLQRR